MKSHALLALAICCFACSESDKECTQAGCLDGVQFSFSTPPDASDVSLILQFDGRELRCDAKKNGSDGCRDAGVWVQWNAGKLDGFYLFSHPEQVTLSVSVAGVVLVSKTVTPTYEVMQPNGPDCPPTCRSGLIYL
jgi:hypothetical protein